MIGVVISNSIYVPYCTVGSVVATSVATTVDTVSAETAATASEFDVVECCGADGIGARCVLDRLSSS